MYNNIPLISWLTKHAHKLVISRVKKKKITDVVVNAKNKHKKTLGKSYKQQ